jgi:serine protein kinase
MSIFSHFQQRFESTRQEELSLQEYLELCKRIAAPTPPPPSVC